MVEGNLRGPFVCYRASEGAENSAELCRTVCRLGAVIETVPGWSREPITKVPVGEVAQQILMICVLQYPSGDVVVVGLLGQEGQRTRVTWCGQGTSMWTTGRGGALLKRFRLTQFV